ncbi:four helix bundle protein [Robertkochia flava]|uniref:four helix bundle protein n=1 Tax=Robertkochia flava TaxID=3447986 RepID=UPI001CCE73D4|nr:four helix bundle protein [Robertkochia marina]
MHYNLIVWKKSVQMAIALYNLTDTFPKHERYGLVSQINRAGVSVAANIAEGSARTSTRDYIKFLNISKASLTELETLLIISEGIGYGDTDLFIIDHIIPIKKMLNKLESTLKNKL